MAVGAKRKQKRSERDLLTQFKRQLASAERHAEEIIRRKDRCQEVYLGTTNPLYNKPRDVGNPKDWRSRFFPPVAFEHAELAIAELCDSTPQYDAVARLDEYEGQAEAAANAIAYYLDRDRFGRTYRTAMRRAVKYGDCPVMVAWRHDSYYETYETTVTDLEEQEDEYGAVFEVPVERVEERTREIVCYDGPTVLALDYHDFLPDPTAKGNVQSARWVIRRWRSTLAELEAAENDDGSKKYKNLSQLRGEVSGGGDSASDKKRPNETTESYEARTTGVVTLYDRWTTSGLVVMANRTTIILEDDDPADPIFKHRKLPFGVIRLIEDDDNLGGISPMMLMDQEQEVFWKCLNDLMDSTSLRVKPPMLADIEGDPRAAEYDIHPGARIPARNGEQTVKVLTDIASLDLSGMTNMLGFVRDLIERTTGMNASVAGMGRSSSATEAADNLAQSKGRIRQELLTSDDDWHDVVELVFQLIQQNADRKIIAKLSGGNEVSFDPEDLHGQFQFTSKLSSERSLKELRQNQLTTLWNAIQPTIQPGTIEYAFLERLLDQLADAYDVENLGPEVRTGDEAMLEQGLIQNQLAAESAQQQGEIQMQQMMEQQAMMPPEPQPGAAPVGY